MNAPTGSAIARVAIRAGYVLLVSVMACTVPAGAATVLPGSGEIVTSGVFTILAGETAVLEGTLAGDVLLNNYGTLLVSGGQVMGQARIDNYGSIGNLNLAEDARLSNSSYVGNLLMNGNAVFSNLGFINNLTMTGSVAGQNNSFINNASMFGNSFLQNNDTLNNARPFAGDGDTVGFQNNGTTNNVDADVLSPNNIGFINIQNNGLIKHLDMLDSVPFQGAPDPDLITVNNAGTIQTIIARTAGIGTWAVNDWGSIWSLDGSGLGSIDFFGDRQMNSLYLKSVGQSLSADGSTPLILSSDLTVGLISLRINGSLAVGQTAAPVPEPGTMALFTAALALGFIMTSRRKAG